MTKPIRVLSLFFCLAFFCAVPAPAQARDLYDQAFSNHRAMNGRGNNSGLEGFKRRTEDRWSRQRESRRSASRGQESGFRARRGGDTSSQRNNRAMQPRQKQADYMKKLEKQYEKMTDMSHQPLVSGGRKAMGQSIGKRSGYGNKW